MAPPAIAIVTGANSGIGLAVSVALAGAGFQVHAGMRDGASPDALLAAAASPDAIHVVRMDVGDDDSVAAAVASVLAATDGRVDVAVANAGYGTIVSVEEASLADHAAVMNVNYFGALRLVKAVLPAMRARGAGRIIGSSSIGGVVGFPFGSPYAASKFAMEGFWESCHAEYKATGVHFALMEPGPVHTGVSSRMLMGSAPPPEMAASYATALAVVKLSMDHGQSADACAAYYLRAATEAAPSFRYLTCAPLEAMLRPKLDGVDGLGVAAALVAMVDAPPHSTQAA